MARTSNRSINIIFAGTLVANNTYAAAQNSATPGDIDLIDLAIGFNLITPPAGGSTPKGCTIIPPAANLNAILLKRVTGDTGINLHLTDPTSLGLGSPTETFGLTVVAAIAGVQLIWT